MEELHLCIAAEGGLICNQMYQLEKYVFARSSQEFCFPVMDFFAWSIRRMVFVFKLAAQLRTGLELQLVPRVFDFST
jgi:hypothetical protein